jgi:hypothetical protein
VAELDEQACEETAMTLHAEYPVLTRIIAKVLQPIVGFPGPWYESPEWGFPLTATGSPNIGIFFVYPEILLWVLSLR